MLDDIPNIGQTRRKALMRQFQSLEKIREATVEQLREVDGMNEKAARSVYESSISSKTCYTVAV